MVFHMASELNRRGHESVVVTPLYGSEEDPAVLDMKASALRLKPAIAFGNAAYLRDIHACLQDADIVHLHYPFFGTANLVRKWKLAHPDTPLVVTYHMDNRSGGWKGLIFSWYAKFWLPKILAVADMLTGSTIDFIEHSDARRVYRDQKEKWVEIPFGVDTNRFHPQEKPRDLFLAHGLDPDAPTIVFVGGMDVSHYFKGVAVLLNAVFQLKRDGTRMQTVLVGDGELRASFERQARALGLSDFVVFAGRVGDEELPRYYAMGDLFVLPSIHQGEAFGMVLLEAMATGVPVVASDLPGVRTVASRAGVTVPPEHVPALAAAIQEFFLPHVDRAALSAQARAAVETDYTWPRIIDRLETVYTELRSKKKPY